MKSATRQIGRSGFYMKGCDSQFHSFFGGSRVVKQCELICEYTESGQPGGAVSD